MTESRNFIDGDLVESFLDLSRNKMEDVVAIMQSEEGWTAPVGPTGQLKEDQIRPPAAQGRSDYLELCLNPLCDVQHTCRVHVI